MTRDAISSGADVIYQAVLLDELWRGDADFLIKCDTPSVFGDFSYEVLDSKLARTAEPKHIMQLCVYSELLGKLQGTSPVNMYLFLGDGERYSFKASDFFYCYSRAKQRFETYIQNLPARSYPEPCHHCHICQWHADCKAKWDADNHLSLVANIQRPQIDALRAQKIDTLAALADAPPTTTIPNLNSEAFHRLRAQAALQHRSATTGENHYEILSCPSGKGFSRMPIADDGDLFFDMEGDPLYPHGLEYLFGVFYVKDGEKIFKPFWAHDHKAEKQTFKRFMGFLEEHLARYPNAHIYHYNHYETTALKRLACRHAVCEEALDMLLRKQQFVDLYLVVREGIRVSEPSYSLKNLETFYMSKRDQAITTAADSIALYNEWRQTDNKQLLQDIAEYNKADCVSTYLLRNWLHSLKPENTPWFKSAAENIEEEQIERKDWELEYEEYQSRLGMEEDRVDKTQELLAYLLEFHRREAKVAWWNCFERQNKLPGELIDDAECLGGLEQQGAPESEKRSLIYTYRFPAQECKLEAGFSVLNIETLKTAGTLIGLDINAGIAKIKRGVSQDPLPTSLSIGPPMPIDSKLVRTAIYGYADHVLEERHDKHVGKELLAKNLPHMRGRQAGQPIIDSQDLQAGMLEAILELDHSYLVVQGPPGAGKTFVSSHMIVDLMQRGKKIGITSNSHMAIHNLLSKVEALAAEKGVQFRGVKKASGNRGKSHYQGSMISNQTKTAEIDRSADLFAGTVWAFAHEHLIDCLDYLFIDEAGQVATANVIAMAHATQNIILVGDQMQLTQPVQGTHTGEAGLSVLDFLLGVHATIPAERGIFLGQSYRMRSSICSFVSDAFYDGRLSAHESTAKRNLDLQDVNLPNEGIVMIPAHHHGCSQQSIEEGEIIEKYYKQLLGQTFTDNDASPRPITEKDILVATPYNAQVNYLRSVLPAGATVGTVDMLQGQEAPIVLISMVTSSTEYMPRNMEFLYSRNRLNVAISRAQCLAVVVANPQLLETPCNTVGQMKLVNTFCYLADYAVNVAA